MKLISELKVVQEATAKGGLLRDFVDYALPLTDAPKVLHLWVALGTLAGPSDPIPQLKIQTFFKLSLVPADYSTININP